MTTQGLEPPKDKEVAAAPQPAVALPKSLRTGKIVIGSAGRSDASIMIGGDYMLATLDITNAQLKAIRTAPITIVPAQAGKIIWPLSAYFAVLPGTVAWTAGGDIYVTTANLISNGYYWFDGIMTWSGTGGHVASFKLQSSPFNNADVAGLPLIVTTDQQSVADPKSGDSGARIQVAYQLMDAT